MTKSTKAHASRKLLTRVGGGVIAATLAMGMVPAVALADTGDLAEQAAAKALQNLNSYGDTDANADDLALDNDFTMTIFDLRHVGGTTTYDAEKKHSVMTGGASFVTPVKLQNPWGTCWAFAAIAASETSLLTASGQSYDEAAAAKSKFADLSERHLAWFAKDTITADGPYASQAGEGNHFLATPQNLTQRDTWVMNAGGQIFVATTILSNGTGPVPESMAPYQNNEGKKADEKDGSWCYAQDGDWSLDSKIRFGTVAELTQSRILPEPKNGSIAGVSAIKSELMNGNAVSIAFAADTSRPGQEVSQTSYINTKTWAHYTWNESAPPNHAVTIVGWDDSYSKENFLQGTMTVDGKTYNMAPPDDGAWIVKNSWGSESNESPNKGTWGDEGYFYMSYYDKSITGAETFVYDTSDEAQVRTNFMLDQYDLSGAYGISPVASDTEVNQANVFPNESGVTERLRDISYLTGTARDTVTLKVYVMDKSANASEYIAANKPNATIEKFTEFKGYNRVSLDEPVIIGKDQKYAIVQTTKQTSGKFEMVYQAGIGKNLTIAINNAMDPIIENLARTQMGAMKEQFKQQTGREMTKDEEEKCLRFMIILLKAQAQRTSYTETVINQGESLLYSDGAWKDWATEVKNVNAALTKEISEKGIKEAAIPAGTVIEDPYAIDNFGIKGYLDTTDVVYRLYNNTTSEHLWTTDANEYKVLSMEGWTQEGRAWSTALEGTPVYRLYNPILGTHHYTSDSTEIDFLVGKCGWVYDRDTADGKHTPMFYASEKSDSNLPVYRLYNGGLSQHMLTLNKGEYDALKNHDWKQEDVAFYVAGE